MRNLILLAALAAACGLSFSASAVERIDEPLTFRHGINWKSNSVLAFARLDVDRFVAEDEIAVRKGQPLRVAIERTEKAGEQYERQGEWSTIDDMSVWRLKVNASDAEWVSFAFDDLFLPPGSALYVYGPSREQVLGPYTDANNKASRKFWTPMVYGDVAFIEINVPTNMRPYLSFNLAKVSQGYRSLKSNSTPKVGACNIDVVCPQGDDWRDEIRSVARYIYESDSGGTFTCTGNMVNNAAGDRKPYFLTANHCVATATEAASMRLFWNFEKSVCGGSADGSQSQTQLGASMLATVGSLDGPEPKRDMTLVELDATPPESFNVHWSGWETSAVPPNSGVSIHHPDGTEKRISVDSGPIVITNFGSTAQNPNGTHLMIAAWDEGTTEGGSSGSGFWDSQKRIVGVLSGGGASCDTPDAPDFYAHLSSHYDVGSTSSTRLKAWLDPDDTGVTRIDGVDGCDAPSVSFSINPNPAEANQNVTFTSNITGAVAGATFAWDFDGDGNTDSTAASPVFAYPNSYIGNVAVTVTNPGNCSGAASAGIVVTPMGGNTPPTASASGPATADENSTVQLDASASSDSDGDALTYSWIQTDGPVAALINASTATPSITLPSVTVDTVVTFEVTVSDAFNATDTDTVSVTALNVNRAPTAVVSNPTLTVTEGATVTLNAAASSDPDNDALSFVWTQTSGVAQTLTNATTSTATFAAPQVSAATALVFSVTVTDVFGATDTASVTVTVNDTPPPVTSGGGGGGGGALGTPVLFAMMLTGFWRRSRRMFQGVLVIAGCSLLVACGTAESGSADAGAENSAGTVSAQAAPDGNKVTLYKRGLEKSAAQITDSKQVEKMVSAFESRERRYEKIKPIFEYEMDIEVDGKSEVWMVSPSGYIQQEQSYELYKMDVTMLKDLMQ